jgi:hypothetical protein
MVDKGLNMPLILFCILMINLTTYSILIAKCSNFQHLEGNPKVILMRWSLKMFVIKKFKAIKNVYENLVSFVLYCGKVNRNTMEVMDLSFFGIVKNRN